MSSNSVVINGTSYQVGQAIGRGLHSNVFSGRDQDGQTVALKVTNFLHGSVDVKAGTESRQQSFWKELKMLLYLQPLNPHIVRVFNYDYNEIYGVIVMERGKTFRDTLIGHMLGKVRMAPDVVNHFWSQMVEAIYYMHRIGIVHGDVKPENFIQVGPDQSTLRLIDMGISFELPPDVTSQLKTAAGTPDYVSPEMVSSRIGSSQYSKCGYKSDVWALGVMLFEMAFGYRPLQALRGNAAKLRFLGALRRNINIPHHSDKNLRDILKLCLRSNPRRRASIKQLRKHPYVRGSRF